MGFLTEIDYNTMLPMVGVFLFIIIKISSTTKRSLSNLGLNIKDTKKSVSSTYTHYKQEVLKLQDIIHELIQMRINDLKNRIKIIDDEWQVSHIKAEIDRLEKWLHD